MHKARTRGSLATGRKPPMGTVVWVAGETEVMARGGKALIQGISHAGMAIVPLGIVFRTKEAALVAKPSA